MTISEKKLKSRAIQLSNYEMDTLEDARKTLTILFGRVCSRDNQMSIAGTITGLEELLNELKENNNQIIEFDEMED